MSEITMQLQVALFKEDGQFVAYCPALELSSYGDTPKEAKQAFDEALDIFVEETTEKGTLEKVLLQLGWSLKRKPKPDYQPPQLDASKVSRHNPSFYKERFAIPV